MKMSDSKQAAAGYDDDQRPRRFGLPSPWCVRAHGCTNKRARVPVGWYRRTHVRRSNFDRDDVYSGM